MTTEQPSIVNLEEYEKVKAELKEKRSEAWEKYNAIRMEETEALKKLINLEGKFLKIDSMDGITYLYVTEQFETEYYSSDIPAILIRGLGFKGCITPYQDNTYFRWDEYTEHYIRLDYDFEKDISEITEITKNDFNNAFEDMISKTLEEHYSFLKDS